MTDLSKEDQWRSHIQACTSSGMSAKAWCKANDIIPHQYHCWKRKFKAAENNPKNDLPEQAPLLANVPQITQPDTTPIILHIGDYKLELTEDFDKKVLLELMNLLANPCQKYPTSRPNFYCMWPN